MQEGHEAGPGDMALDWRVEHVDLPAANDAEPLATGAGDEEQQEDLHPPQRWCASQHAAALGLCSDPQGQGWHLPRQKNVCLRSHRPGAVGGQEEEAITDGMVRGE